MLSRNNHGGEASPPLLKLLAGKHMAVPGGAIGGEHVLAVAASDHHNLPAGVATWRPAHNHRAPSIGITDNLIQCPVVAPGGLEAETFDRFRDAHFLGES